MNTSIKINGQTVLSTDSDFSHHLETHHRGTVLKINPHDFKIGFEDGSVLTINRTEMADPDFAVDDVVEVYRDGREFILRTLDVPTPHPRKRPAHEYDKNLFIWVGTFLFGYFGVDRFMRGQVAIGIAKIFLGPCTIFIWDFADFIIALYNAHSGYYATRKNFTFDAEGEYMH